MPVTSTSLQSDGQIIITGLFTTYNGTSRNRIARLNSNGSLDTSFNPGTGADLQIDATSLQLDGKILIG
ncbi:MAG: delta-60 repeat domain-containing protein [bacterium]